MQKLRIGTGVVTAEIWTLGAALNAVWAPDRDGKLVQVDQAELPLLIDCTIPVAKPAGCPSR